MVNDYNTWFKANLLGEPQIFQTKEKLGSTDAAPNQQRQRRRWWRCTQVRTRTGELRGLTVSSLYTLLPSPRLATRWQSKVIYWLNRQNTERLTAWNYLLLFTLCLMNSVCSECLHWITDSHSTVITEVSSKKRSAVTTRGSQHCITEGILLCGLTRLYWTKLVHFLLKTHKPGNTAETSQVHLMSILFLHYLWFMIRLSLIFMCKCSVLTTWNIMKLSLEGAPPPLGD